ncbi:MAG: transketolase [Halanaerobiales bacterium]
MLQEAANIVKGLSADAVERANSGHPGMPIGAAEIGTLLFGEVMKHDPDDPEWPDRDRFVLSAGHGSMLLYSLLYLSGYDLTMDDLKNFRQLHSKTPGHPEYRETPGIETTTGPLGQGLANAVGMALAERNLAEKFNTESEKIVNHYTYVLAGDGCMMEGITSEASSFAGHLGLGKLIVFYDDNRVSIEGKTDITFTESVADRYRAYNWQVIENVDGHDISELREAIEEAKKVDNKPTLIMARTHIAHGAPDMEDDSGAHGAPLGKEEIRGLKENYDLPPDKEFYVSASVEEFFEEQKEKLKSEKEKWEEKFKKWGDKNPELLQEWENAREMVIPASLESDVFSVDIDTPTATRKAGGAVLKEIADHLPYLIGGSADLAPSNKTYLDKYDEIQPDNFGGRNIRFGVREHAMGAIANGISCHGGLRPYVATFLVFSDYMRPAIRMASLMELPIIYIFTHDSIFIGEDGPTHQPVEQLESLRLIPNLKVLRPADEEETRAAWMTALEYREGPVALVLTRQNLPLLNKMQGLEDWDRGGYLLKGSRSEKTDVVFMASGSEVSLAVEATELLEKEDINCRVVSIADRKKFVQNDSNYIKDLIGGGECLRVLLEAGVGQGWYQLLDSEDLILSVEDFGCSAPGEEVGEEFGFTASKVVEKVKNEL